MDKKQFEAKKAIIDKHRGLIDALMADVEKEYAEAEKPELRNWEIGVDGEQRWIKLDGKVYWLHDRQGVDPGGPSCHPDENFADDLHVNINDVLDDLKALSEPLEHFKADVHTYSFDFLNLPQTPIQIAGNWHPLKEAEEICMKIQRVIYTAKQSKAKNDTDN